MYSLRKINLLIFIIMTIVLHSYLQLRAYAHWTHYNACISLDLLPRIHISMHRVGLSCWLRCLNAICVSQLTPLQ